MSFYNENGFYWREPNGGPWRWVDTQGVLWVMVSGSSPTGADSLWVQQ